MMNTIAIDVASEVSSVCVMSPKGKIKQEELVPTRISSFKKLIKEVPRPRQVVFEEGTQAAWLWSELQGICDDILVCDPRSSAKLGSRFKSDKNDARHLAKGAQSNSLSRVWHGGKELQSIKEAVRAYQCLTEESTRLKNQIKAVFRGCGVKVEKEAYNSRTRAKVISKLRLAAQRERVTYLGKVLDVVRTQQALALKALVKACRKNSMYKPIYAIDGFGPVFTSMFISEVGNPHRFRTKQQFWSYCGLAVTTHESAEYELKNGRPVRRQRGVKTRGLVREYNRTLKGVFKQSAMTLSRTKWKAQYQQILKNSKNENNAMLTLARKIACVALHIAKTGEKYELTKVFKAI